MDSSEYRFHTMRSRHAGYFYSPPSLPLSYLSHNSGGEPEANQLPHQWLCGVTSAIQH